MEFIRKSLKKVVLPTSNNKELARREYILNILLVGSLVLAIFALLVNLFDSIIYGNLYKGELPTTTIIIVLALLFLLFLSKKGSSQLSAKFLVFLLLILSLSVSYRWGADSYQALLMFSLIIIMGGILISTKTAFLITLISGIVTIGLAFSEAHHITNPDYEWKFRTIRMGEAIVVAITLCIIAVVSWLSNREINNALKRVLRSESALKRQRDKLEITVEKRTEQLKQSQSEKIAQLYRFAQFGRLSSGLFHDLVNPLTLVSINLDKIHLSQKGNREVSEAMIALDRAIIGTQKLQSFIVAAKRQIQAGQALEKYSLVGETNLAIQILEHKCEEKKITIQFIPSGEIKIFGNPLKFNQLVTNLLSNAIDAYDQIRRKDKKVEIRIQKKDREITLSVQDWGSGIDKQVLPRIFDPLFTTKDFEKGTGIGLSICKDIVEKDLKGKFFVQTEQAQGTQFTIIFPQKTHKG